MSCLIGLPVKGESYLFFRNKKSFLVDSGCGAGRLISALEKLVPDIDTVNAAICTHADSDHSGGFQKILDQRPNLIKEFWLPGSWAPLIRAFNSDPKSACAGLIEELNVAASYLRPESGARDREIEKNEPDSIDAITLTPELFDRWKQFESTIFKPDSRRILHAWRPKERDDKDGSTSSDKMIPDMRQPEWLEALQSRAREGDLPRRENIVRAFSGAKACVTRGQTSGEYPQNLGVLWKFLIDAAKQIVVIAESAIEHNIPIRWFDFKEFQNGELPFGGEPGVLQPVNAVEVIPNWEVSEYACLLYLSTVNKEGLVFWAPETISDPGVLFTGDSPLCFDMKNPVPNHFLKAVPRASRAALITAPHHGSNNNDCAYDAIKDWIKAPDNHRWLRMGGSKIHPNGKFCNQKHRACVGCTKRSGQSKSNYNVRATIIPASSGNWLFPPINHRPCDCT